MLELVQVLSLPQMGMIVIMTTPIICLFGPI